MKGTGTTPRLICLGLDSGIESRMSLPEKKFTNIKWLLDKFLLHIKMSVRQLAKIVLKIQGSRRAWVLHSESMPDSVIVSSIAIEELVFCKVNIFYLHGCPCVLDMTEEVVELEVESDVSDVGIFAYLVDRPKQMDV